MLPRGRSMSRLCALALCGLSLSSAAGCSSQALSTHSSDSPVSSKTDGKATLGHTSGTKEVNPPETITVEGEGLTPEQKKAVATWGKQLLAEAIGRIIQEAHDKLGITDEVEVSLFSALSKVDPQDGLVSVHLIKPGNGRDSPRTTVLVDDGKPCIRLTRAFAALERPVAVVTITAIVKGQPSVSEWFLSYEANGQWKMQQPSSRIENMSR